MSLLEASSWATLIERRVRGRLSRVVAAVRGAGRPESAWESLAARDLIPHDWITGTRAFAPASMCGRCDRGLTPGRYRWGRRSAPWTRCRACLDRYDDCDARAVPPSLDDVIGLALDPPGVMTAEALGLEVAARLAEDGPCAQRVLWRFRGARDAGPLVEVEYDDARLRASDALRACAGELEDALTDDDDGDFVPRFDAAISPPYGAPSPARRHLALAAIWRAAQRMVLDPRTAPCVAAYPADDPVEVLLARHAAWASERVGQALGRNGADRLAALTGDPNPYEPAVAIWALGYGIEAVTEQCVVLIAPTYDA